MHENKQPLDLTLPIPEFQEESFIPLQFEETGRFTGKVNWAKPVATSSPNKLDIDLNKLVPNFDDKTENAPCGVDVDEEGSGEGELPANKIDHLRSQLQVTNASNIIVPPINGDDKKRDRSEDEVPGPPLKRARKNPIGTPTAFKYRHCINNYTPIYKHMKKSFSRLVIFNLCPTSDLNETLFLALAPFGYIRKLWSVVDKQIPSDSFAFVEFGRKKEAENALVALQGSRLLNRWIGIDRSPTEFDRTSRNIIVKYTTATRPFSAKSLKIIFKRRTLNRKFGQCLLSYLMTGQDGPYALMKFGSQTATHQAIEYFHAMGFDVSYTFGGHTHH